MNHVKHPLSSAEIGNHQICYTKKYRYRLHFHSQFLNLLTFLEFSHIFFFFEFSNIVLIYMVTVSMMSAKMTTLRLLKIKVFWNKSYDVKISVNDVNKKIIMWLKLYCTCGHVTKVS